METLRAAIPKLLLHQLGSWLLIPRSSLCSIPMNSCPLVLPILPQCCDPHWGCHRAPRSRAGRTHSPRYPTWISWNGCTGSSPAPSCCLCHGPSLCVGTAEELSAGTHPLAVGLLLRLQNCFYLFFSLTSNVQNLCSEQRTEGPVYYGSGGNKSSQSVTDSSQTKLLLCAPGCAMGLLCGWRRKAPFPDALLPHFCPVLPSRSGLSSLHGAAWKWVFLSHLLAGCPWMTPCVPFFLGKQTDFKGLVREQGCG